MKTLVWIIGKPGSGKTTIGQSISKSMNEAIHFSYGQILQEVRPNLSVKGYTIEDRKKADLIILKASNNYQVIIVDSQVGFGLIERIKDFFDEVKVIYLCLEDSEALLRLKLRDRKILVHEGSTHEDRIKSFNEKQLPLIKKYRESFDIKEIGVNSDDSIDDIVHKVLKELI